MQVFQTEGEPPSSGSSSLAISGWTQNNSAALRNKVVEKSALMPGERFKGITPGTLLKPTAMFNVELATAPPHSTIPSFGGSGSRKLATNPTRKTAVPTIAAALATCSNVVPAKCGATRFVVTNAAEVPNIRPPTLVAKLPPVPRKCRGKTLGRYSPK